MGRFLWTVVISHYTKKEAQEDKRSKARRSYCDYIQNQDGDAW